MADPTAAPHHKYCTTHLPPPSPFFARFLWQLAAREAAVSELRKQLVAREKAEADLSGQVAARVKTISVLREQLAERERAAADAEREVGA